MPNARIAPHLAPRLAPRLVLAGAALLLLAAAPSRTATRPPGTPIVLQQQRGSPVDTAARQLVAADLTAARARGDRPLVLSATANLGGDRPALFVQLQSPGECGSAGCTTAVYAWEHGAWRQVLDGTTGKLSVSPKRTRGRFDIIADDDHFVWTGTAYRSTHPAPALDLRPHPARPARR